MGLTLISFCTNLSCGMELKSLLFWLGKSGNALSGNSGRALHLQPLGSAGFSTGIRWVESILECYICRGHARSCGAAAKKLWYSLVALSSAKP